MRAVGLGEGMGREREREKEKTGGPRRLDRGPDGITQFEHKFEGL